MRVFLDIGSHIGETVEEVAKSKYAFDRIVCFEPVSSCVEKLKSIKDDRVEVCPFGLSNRDAKVELHDPGSVGGSIYETQGDIEVIELRDAATWFADNLSPDDFIVVKTNCEGSEVDVIESLLDADLMSRPYVFLVTFDIRNYPDQRHREGIIRKRLRRTGLRNFCFSDDVMLGPTHQKRIEYWLRQFGVDQPHLSAQEGRERFIDNFTRYSRKTGRLVRVETLLKQTFGYETLPGWAKRPLRALKGSVGLHRETRGRR